MRFCGVSSTSSRSCAARRSTGLSHSATSRPAFSFLRHVSGATRAFGMPFRPATGVPSAQLDALATWADGHVGLDSIGDDQQRVAALNSFPGFVVAELAPRLDQSEIAALLGGLNEPAPLSLRVNTYKAPVDEAVAALEREGFVVRRGRLAPEALVVERTRDLFASEAFQSGVVEVQDEGSQVVSLLVDPRPGRRVLDLCAGSGGKTLHLGALMRGRGEVFAYDTDVRRLSNIDRRLRRSGLQNVRVLRTDERFEALRSTEYGSFDAVLVDAPCSGLGSVRRAPDIKRRTTRELVDAMVRKQRAVLETAAGFVRVGGRLVYATCSILPRENEGVVGNFVARHPAFDLVPVERVAADAARYRGADALEAAALGREMLTLTPHEHGTDGFFVAVLERTRGES